jgi:hypothetical protein
VSQSTQTETPPSSLIPQSFLASNGEPQHGRRKSAASKAAAAERLRSLAGPSVCVGAPASANVHFTAYLNGSRGQSCIGDALSLIESSTGMQEMDVEESISISPQDGQLARPKTVSFQLEEEQLQKRTTSHSRVNGSHSADDAMSRTLASRLSPRSPSSLSELRPEASPSQEKAPEPEMSPSSPAKLTGHQLAMLHSSGALLATPPARSNSSPAKTIVVLSTPRLSFFSSTESTSNTITPPRHGLAAPFAGSSPSHSRQSPEALRNAQPQLLPAFAPGSFNSPRHSLPPTPGKSIGSLLATPPQLVSRHENPALSMSPNSHASPRVQKGKCPICSHGHTFPRCGQSYCLLCGKANHIARNCTEGGVEMPCTADEKGEAIFEGRRVCYGFQFKNCAVDGCQRLHVCSICVLTSHGSQRCPQRERLPGIRPGTLREDVVYP